MIEKISTRPFKIKLPEGKRITFRVQGVPQKKMIGKAPARTWILLPDLESYPDPIAYDIMSFMAKDLLLALGFKDDPEKQVIAWDDSKVDGKEFSAEVAYEDSKKLNPNTGEPYRNMVLRNFEAEISF